MVDILVRNVRPELHRALKIEAARQGVTLSEVVRRMVEAQYGERPRTQDPAIVPGETT